MQHVGVQADLISILTYEIDRAPTPYGIDIPSTVCGTAGSAFSVLAATMDPLYHEMGFKKQPQGYPYITNVDRQIHCSI